MDLVSGSTAGASAGYHDARRAAEEFAANNGLVAVTASAKTDSGVAGAFVGLARMLQKRGAEAGPGARLDGGGGVGAGSMPPQRTSSVFDCCRTS